MRLDARVKLFVLLAGLFITCLIVGDLIGGKLYQLDAGGLDDHLGRRSRSRSSSC
jgi:hypothetical protein